MNPGLYLHIPFCEQRCYYCAFTVAVAPESAFEVYCSQLIRELDLAGFGGTAGTVYLGGGTPSLLPPELVSRLLKRIGRLPSEVTLEANPGTLSEAKLRCYREYGVSRISLGAQSLEDEDLERAGRLHKAAAVYEDYALLRRFGFTNVNLDLIAGLPQQNLSTWTKNLDKVIVLRPEHISVYMLDREERSRWGKLPVIEGLPEQEDFAAFYGEAVLRLEAAGYEQYEISNWALPGFACRHNLGYWNGVPYRGFGVGAHSYDGTERSWNTASLAEYAERLSRGELPTTGSERLTAEMQLEEAFMLGLRQTRGLDLSRLQRLAGLHLPEAWQRRARQLESAGLIVFEGSFVKLTHAGRLVANSVIEELIWPTPSSTFEATP
jgi:oxygen-independent coproporphyrinogen-3 oxidase